MKQLRPYQQDLINLIRASFMSGNRRVLAQSATGSGKSIVFSEIIHKANEKRKNVLFLVHRRELILQASKHLWNYGIEHGVIMSKIAPSLMANVQVASIQTLWARCHTHNKIPFPEADLIVIDEAHVSGSKTYVEIMKYYPNAKILGVTATPIRKGGVGLGDCFDSMVIGTSVRELMDLGYLAEAEYMIPNSPDLSKVKTLGGDWIESQLSAVMNEKKLIGDQLSHFKKYAHDKKTMIFATDVAHSLAMFDKFHDAGYRIAHVDGKTDTNTRANIFKDFESGRLQLITNVGIAIEGIDIPDTECMIDVAPTKSLGRYLQKGGRILRPKKGGSKALILDHAGNWWRHGSLDEPRDWSLDVVEKIQDREKKKAEPKEGGEKREFACSGCGNIFSGSNVCPKCGTKLDSNVKDVEHHRGELVKADKSAKKEEKVYDHQEWYGMFLGYAEQKGYQRGHAYHAYIAKFGKKPNKDFHGVPLLPTPEFKKYTTYLNIRKAKSKFKRGKK